MIGRLLLGLVLLVTAVVFSPPVRAQGSGGKTAGTEELRFHVNGAPDIVLPRMDPARGRIYFATRACVVCHSVNGVGGSAAPALDNIEDNGALRPLEFVSRMWRGGPSMIGLQESLFGEPIDLTAEELGDIMAFLNDAEQKKRFSESDIPKYIRDFMMGREGAPRN